MAPRVAKSVVNKVIAYAFMVGVLIALVLGLLSKWVPENATPWLVSLLVLAGIVVGFFNITASETKDFVLFITALVLISANAASAFAGLEWAGEHLQNVLNMLMAFLVPAGIVVGVKAVLNLARD
jgi:hypothetical protein